MLGWFDMDELMVKHALIASALAGGMLPFERMLFAPEADAAGGGGGAPQQGEQPAQDAPKYTDKQANDLIAKNIAKAEAKLKAEFEAQQKALREELEAAKNEAALAGKSAEEKAKLIADSDAKKRAAEQERIAKELAETREARVKAEAQLRHYHVSSAATRALSDAKVLATAASDALDLFMAKAQVDFEDDGMTVKAVTIDGAYHKTMKDAAEAFVKARPAFQPAPVGGSGTPRSAAQILVGGRKFSDLSPEEALEFERQRRNGR